MKRAAMVTALAMSLFGAAECNGASLPKFPSGTPYAEARRSLIALGYEPATLPDADKCEKDNARCFPEVESCAGTGLGPCIYTWRRGETLIEVFTVYERPIVRGVKCRVNC